MSDRFHIQVVMGSIVNIRIRIVATLQYECAYESVNSVYPRIYIIQQKSAQTVEKQTEVWSSSVREQNL